MLNVHFKNSGTLKFLYCINLFKSSINELSKGKIRANCVVKEIQEPITSMSYDEENGYYVGPYDVRNVIDKYIKEGQYDHIFAIFRTGDINAKSEIPVNDWIGLGGMDYLGIGFSNIRLPNDENSYTYKYSSRINTFPEEVFIHEYLHTLERILKEQNYDIPALHDYEKYGYENESKVGLKRWYEDYMNCEIQNRETHYLWESTRKMSCPTTQPV